MRMTGCRTAREAWKALDHEARKFADQAEEVFKRMDWTYYTLDGERIPDAGELWRTAKSLAWDAFQELERGHGSERACLSAGRMRAEIFKLDTERPEPETDTWMGLLTLVACEARGDAILRDCISLASEQETKRLEDSLYIYFTPQTGVITDVLGNAPSNFYVYKLSKSLRPKVEEAVNIAKLESSGLVYTKELLDWLGKNDLN